MPDPIAALNATLEGRYRIERKLGEGGMAAVYLAEDLRHERKVALKVLKPELAAVVGAERFLAEIKTTANLQHPHILPLFDSGEAAGFLFYVMPYVEGETLREKLDRERQLPIDEAVRIAEAVAQALQHAHERGVIHRDIKPGNILLQDGQPVVSDFGIALAVSAAGGGRLTETGLSLGTPYYMSPEQASADREPSAASDVYSLGCVLYEMLVGEPPYSGGSAQAVLAKILMEDARAPRKTRGSIPTHVDAAIRKALEKLPADRFGTVQDFAKALGDRGFRHGEEAVGGPGGARGLWNPLSMTTTGVAAVLALALGWSALKPSAAPPPQPVSREVISAAPAAPVVTGSTVRDVAISRDGQTIVYQTALQPGQLAVRPLDQLGSLPLRGPDAAIAAFLSPDGRWVGFQAGTSRQLQRVSIQGGPPQTLVDLPVDLTDATWGPDDMIVYSVAAPEGLYRLRGAGGEATALTETDGTVAHEFPDVLPNGAGVLFTLDSNGSTATDNQIAVLDLRTNERRLLIPSGSFPRYAASGHVVYALGNTLMAVPFDLDRLEVTGDPVPVVEGVLVKSTGLADFSLSETGSLVYVSGNGASGVPLAAVWVDPEGREEPLPLPPRAYQNPRLSPDGTRLAIGVPDAGGSEALWVFDVVSAAGLRLTQEGQTTTPVWVSNDRLAFATNVEGGGYEIYTVMADGSSPPERLLANEGIVGDYPTSVTPDGRSLIFSRLITVAHREILKVPLQGDPTPKPILQGEFNRGNGEVSPDGDWLVYRSDQSGDMEVYVQPYPGPGPTVPVSIGGGTSVTWSPDGTELIYRLGDRMMAVSFDASSGTPRIGRPRELFHGSYYAVALGGARQYHIAPDGRFLMFKAASSGEGGELPPQVILVQNFFEELKRLAPN